MKLTRPREQVLVEEGAEMRNEMFLLGLKTSRGLLVFSVEVVFAIRLHVSLSYLVDSHTTKAALVLSMLTTSLTFNRIVPYQFSHLSSLL